MTIPAGATVGGMQVLGTLGHLSALQQRELSKYVYPAQFKAMKTSACQPPSPKPTVSEGSPSSPLLSALAVLRRPASRSDLPKVPHVSQPLYPSGVEGVYVRYVRRAQVKAGFSYYIVPAARLVEDPQFSAACRAKQVAVLRSDRCPAFPPASARRRSNGDLQESTGSTFSGVVPDGVATVTVHYPASNGTAALTFTTHVVGNVFAVRIPGLTLGRRPSAEHCLALGIGQGHQDDLDPLVG